MEACDVLDQAPLGEATLRMLGYVFEPAFLGGFYDEHRQHTWEGKLSFAEVVSILSDCLTQKASVHRRWTDQEDEDDGNEPCPHQPSVSLQAFYGKLGRVPIRLSEDFLRESTARLGTLIEPGELHEVPSSLSDLRPILVDSRTIKNASKRVLPARGKAGAALGGKTLTALDYQKGMIVALAASADADVNETTLLERLVEQFLPPSSAAGLSAGNKESIGKRLLFVADRQYGDLKQPRRFLEAGEFLVRLPLRVTFAEDPARPLRRHVDRDGRQVVEQWGWIGKEASQRLEVRRIAVLRQDGEEVVLITSLLDGDRHGALDLLELYRERWTIENVFREVVQTFDLKKLIGSRPLAMVFQASFCMLLYNVVQSQRQLAAQSRTLKGTPTQASEVSTANLFDSVRRSLSAIEEMVGLTACVPLLIWTGTIEQLRDRLLECMGRSWTKWWIKRKTIRKEPHTPPPPKPKKSGGHFSVQRAIDQHEAEKKAKRKNV